MTEVELPYEVWALILQTVDGVSILSLSCVSRRLNFICKTFLSENIRRDYWWKACTKELNNKHLQLCQSGN